MDRQHEPSIIQQGRFLLLYDWVIPLYSEPYMTRLAQISAPFWPFDVVGRRLVAKRARVESPSGKVSERKIAHQFGDEYLHFNCCIFPFKSVVTCHAPLCRSRTLVEVMRHASLRRTSTPSRRPQNPPKNAQKSENFGNFSFRMPKFSRCHAKIWRLPKCRVGKTGHASHPMSI